MAKNKNGNTVELVKNLVEPIVEQLGLMLWDVRFVKEGASWYLRIFIDRDGGVTIDDCETVSRAIDQPLDELDPIEQSYCLEVSSPGIERELVRYEHFEAFLGAKIMVKTIRPDESGVRDFKGTLIAHDRESITVALESGKQRVIRKKDAVYIKSDDFDI